MLTRRKHRNHTTLCHQVSLLCLQSFSSLILQSFQNVIERNIVIALFLTMLTGTAGNAGNQVGPLSLAFVSQRVPLLFITHSFPACCSRTRRWHFRAQMSSSVSCNEHRIIASDREGHVSRSLVCARCGAVCAKQRGLALLFSSTSLVVLVFVPS